MVVIRGDASLLDRLARYLIMVDQQYMNIEASSGIGLITARTNLVYLWPGKDTQRDRESVSTYVREDQFIQVTDAKDVAFVAQNIKTILQKRI